MNRTQFKIQMMRHGDTQKTLAAFLHLPQSAISARMNGKTEFRENEIKALRNRWELDAGDTIAVFFTDEVSETDTSAVGA